MNRTAHRSLAVVAAAATTLATGLLTGLATGPAALAAPPPTAAVSTSVPAAQAKAGTTVLLPTGERIARVTTSGKPAYAVVPSATGGSGSSAAKALGPMRRLTLRGEDYVVPQAAMRRLGSVLDPALFKVSGSAGSSERVAVRITHTGGRPSLPGVTITSDRGGVATGYLTADSARGFGAAVAADATGTGSLFRGITKVAPFAGATPAPTVDQKFPMYTLIIKGIDGQGRKAEFASGLLLNVDDGRRYGGFVLIDRGEARVSVPAGRYDAIFDLSDFGGPDPSIRMLTTGEFQVTRSNTVVTVDARKATTRLTLQTPRPATAGSTNLGLNRVDAAGMSSISSSILTDYSAPVLVRPTPAPAHGTLDQSVVYDLSTRDGSGYTLGFTDDHVDADQARRVTAAQLTTIEERHGTDMPGGSATALFVRVPLTSAGGFATFLPLQVPVTRTVGVYADTSLRWSEEEWGSADTDDPGRLAAERTFPSGGIVKEAWRTGVLSPQVLGQGSGLCFACRSDRSMALALAPYADAAGHDGDMFTAPDGSPVTTFRLERDSTLLTEEDDAYGVVGQAVPATAATYKVTYDVDRYFTGAELATRSHTVLTFRSAAGQGPLAPPSSTCLTGSLRCRVLPLLQARVDLPTDDAGSMTPGRKTVLVSVGRIAGATASPVTEATLRVRPAGFEEQEYPLISAGGGRYQAKVDLPPFLAGRLLDMTVVAKDAAGGTLEQTVSRAARLVLPSAEPAASPTTGEVAAASPWSAEDAATRSACSDVRPGQVRCLAQWRPGAGTAAKAPGAAAAPPARGLGPADIASAYQLDQTKGAGQTVAIVAAFGHPTIEADLAVARAAWGLPACTTANGCFRKVDQRGGTAYPEGDPGWGLEQALDTQAVSAACPKCKILLVQADSPSFDDIGAAVNRAVAMGATIVSNSYGADEFGRMRQYLARSYDHAGVAMVVSSGDFGFTAASFPAVAPRAIAVGGTTLRKTDGAWTEKAWSGAGSGCSAYIAKPSWQRDRNCQMRMNSDVSAVADPRTGLAVYDTYGLGEDNGWLVVGGTSLSAPLVAGMIGLAGNAAQMDSAQRIYRQKASLHDVVGGRNGYCGGDYICTGLRGYDGPTGNGSPRGVGAL